MLSLRCDADVQHCGSRRDCHRFRKNRQRERRRPLRGTWTAVRAEQTAARPRISQAIVLLVEDGNFSITENGITIFAGTLWLDEAATPWPSTSGTRAIRRRQDLAGDLPD